MKLVMTAPHPAKAAFKPLEDPPYIAGSRFPWLATRGEELFVVLFLVAVSVYVACFYATGYAVLYPVKLMLNYSWDLVLGSMVLLRLHGRLLVSRPPSRKAIAAMPPAEQESAQKVRKAAARASTSRRNGAFAMCALAGLARWYLGWGDVRSLLER